MTLLPTSLSKWSNYNTISINSHQHIYPPTMLTFCFSGRDCRWALQSQAFPLCIRAHLSNQVRSIAPGSLSSPSYFIILFSFYNVSKQTCYYFFHPLKKKNYFIFHQLLTYFSASFCSKTPKAFSLLTTIFILSSVMSPLQEGFDPHSTVPTLFLSEPTKC